MPVVYRLKAAGLYQATAWGDLIQKQPCYEPATRADKRFLLSARGVGVHPLALVGTLAEIDQTLDFFQDHVIENQAIELPHLYVGVRRHEPGPMYDGLYPLEEMAKRVFRMAATVAPVPSLGGVIGDMAERFGINVNLPLPVQEVVEFIDEHGDDVERIQQLMSQRDSGQVPFLIHPDQELAVILHYLKPKDATLSVAELPLQAGSRVLPGHTHDVQAFNSITFIELKRRLWPLLARVTTWLPSFEQWKAASSAGRLAIRRRSRILSVDHAYLDYLKSVDTRAGGGGDRAHKLALLMLHVRNYRDQKDAEGDHGQRLQACRTLLQQIDRELRHLA